MDITKVSLRRLFFYIRVRHLFKIVGFFFVLLFFLMVFLSSNPHPDDSSAALHRRKPGRIIDEAREEEVPRDGEGQVLKNRLDPGELKRQIHDQLKQEKNSDRLGFMNKQLNLRPDGFDDNRPLLKAPSIDRILNHDELGSKKEKDLTVKMAMSEVLGDRDEMIGIQRAMYKAQDRPEDKAYNLNVSLSESISLDRDIPDTRPEACKRKQFNEGGLLMMTSVIIPFYNEPLSMLLRTVHSVLNRTPDKLLAEVILVDDKSTYEYLQHPLDVYIQLLPKVKIIRNNKREGLIRSRLIGFERSTGDVIVFLDAHTECNTRWLEPLLEELDQHPNSVLQPFIDGIDANSIAYNGPPTIYKGAFSWDLRYTWLRLPDHQIRQIKETGMSFPSPTLVGCALVVKKDYFRRIGLFDDGLNVWGGENIELAWRVWMCGGSVMTVTCSRVGHVFKNFPYQFDGDRETIVQKNLMRLAETWMDGYRKYFFGATRVYEYKRIEFTEEEKRSVDKRRELRKSLKCRSFDWYMYNLLPEIESPPMDAQYYGEIMNMKTRSCFEVLPSDYIGITFTCYEHKIIPKNYFRLSHKGLLQYRDKCVTFERPLPMLYLKECPEHDATPEQIDRFGRWRLVNRGHVWGGLMVSKTSALGKVEDWCIAQVTNSMSIHPKEQMPQIVECSPEDLFQTWLWTYKFDYHV